MSSPSIDDVSAVAGPGTTPDGCLCFDLADCDRGLLEAAATFAGGWLRDTVSRHTGPTWKPDGCSPSNAWPLWEYGATLLTDLPLPGYRILGAIAHYDLPLPYHTDQRAPAGTVLNATTLFVSSCEGGELVLLDQDVAFAAEDLRVVVYYGGRRHGVAPFTLAPGGYRLSLTYWLGSEEP